MTPVDYYKQYVGTKELETVLSRFDANKFCRTWDQVLTSRSTMFLGSGGSEYSSVTATYSPAPDNKVKVFNKCYDEQLRWKTIEGVSECIDPAIPTCRTVFFPSVGVVGNYWILYISKKKDVMIVCSPLILYGSNISIKLLDNLALYVLASNRTTFWENKKMVKKIYKILEKYNFTSFYNKPIYSGV